MERKKVILEVISLIEKGEKKKRKRKGKNKRYRKQKWQRKKQKITIAFVGVPIFRKKRIICCNFANKDCLATCLICFLTLPGVSNGLSSEYPLKNSVYLSHFWDHGRGFNGTTEIKVFREAT